MNLGKIEHIVVQGFIEDEAGQHWSQCGDEKTTSFTVYRRVPTNEEGEFDMLGEQDFSSFEEAEAYAEQLAASGLQIFID